MAAAERARRATAAAALKALVELRGRFGDGAAERKRALVRALDRARLASAAQVLAFHDTLLFLLAYPDDLATRAVAYEALARFPARRDFARHRAALEDSGIAGADVRFRFFAPTARWLAARFGPRLRVDWKAFENAERLNTFLPLLVQGGEAPGVDEFDLGVRGWVDRLRSPAETDAAFLVRAFSQLPVDAAVRDALWDELDAPLVLDGRGAATPSRTLDAAPEHLAPAFAPRRTPLDRSRPDVARELRRPPLAWRDLSRADGEALLDLARAAMVTRSRDLDAFAYGDPDDARLVECGDGLQFACFGVRPERRLALESVYAMLTLRHGVPIGYVLASGLFGSSEVAYNVFETWRGAEAGRVYGRVLSMVHALFGSTVFTIDPYQLGYHNDEALDSGAWWFYQKTGFRPLDPATRALMREELARLERDPRHRTPRARLERLASTNLFWFRGRERRDVLAVLALGRIGLHATRLVATRFGGDRARAERECAREAGRLLGVRSFAGFGAGERLWWRRWSTIVPLLGAERWSAAERKALAAVIRAKGGRRESEFVRRFDAHRKLRAAIRRLAADARIEDP